MAKKSVINRNAKRVLCCAKYKAVREELKGIIMNRGLSRAERYQASLRIQDLPKDSARVRQRNRCVVTGRGRGYSRMFGLSRMVLRQMCCAGLVPGVVKASW